MKPSPKQKVRKVKAFAIASARNVIVGQYAVFAKVNEAKKQCREWNESRGDPTLKVIPVTLSYLQ